MTRTKTRSKTLPDIHATVTARIIEQMEGGTVPWTKPWESATAPLALPYNPATDQTYSGINVLLLWDAALQAGRTTPLWLTYRQAQKLGGTVRRGERGTTVVYADSFVPKAEKRRARETGDDPQRVGFLKRYTVFNAEQCDDLPEDLYAPPAPLPLEARQEAAETLLQVSGARIVHGGGRAFYHWKDDLVRLPPPADFPDSLDYYRTALHELVHWTGHAARLNRPDLREPGWERYAREELVAEMGAAFLCAELGIAPTLRHASYVKHWLGVLRTDARAVVQAASRASAASRFLLDRVAEAA